MNTQKLARNEKAFLNNPSDTLRAKVIALNVPVDTGFTSRYNSRIGFVSSRENEVLQLIAHEYSSKEIAKQLFISVETVNSHRKNLMYKLNVKNTAGMVRVACMKNMIRPSL